MDVRLGRKECPDDLGIPLSASPVRQNAFDCFLLHSLTVGTITSHSIECIRDRQNTGHTWNLHAGQTMRIPPSVVALMVVENPIQQGL